MPNRTTNIGPHYNSTQMPVDATNAVQRPMPGSQAQIDDTVGQKNAKMLRHEQSKFDHEILSKAFADDQETTPQKDVTKAFQFDGGFLNQIDGDDNGLYESLTDEGFGDDPYAIFDDDGGNNGDVDGGLIGDLYADDSANEMADTVDQQSPREMEVGDPELYDDLDDADMFEVSISRSDDEADANEDQLVAERKQWLVEDEAYQKKFLDDAEDKSRLLKAKITPETLQQHRRNKAKFRKLPVYIAARPLAGATGPMKGMGVHGFVALGRPGLGSGEDDQKNKLGWTKAQGAKVFSYGRSNHGATFNLSAQLVGRIATAKADDRNVFPKEIGDAAKDIASSGWKSFSTFADFHRIYFNKRMDAEFKGDAKLLTSQKDRENLTKDRQALMIDGVSADDPAIKDINTKIAKTERKIKTRMSVIHNDINKEVQKIFLFASDEARRASALDQSIFENQPMAGSSAEGKFTTRIDSQVIEPESQTRHEKRTAAHVRRQWEATPAPENQRSLAETDAQLFESKDYKNKRGLVLNEQPDVNALDVIEAHRMEMMAANYRREKQGATHNLPFAPELTQAPDSMMSYDEFMKSYSDNKMLAMTRAVTDSYAPVKRLQARPHQDQYVRTIDNDAVQSSIELNRDAIDSKQQSKDALKDKQIYSGAVSVKKDVWGIGRLVRLFRRMFTSKKSPLRDSGNCNSAAGSLVRLAGRLNGKRVTVEHGALQHGIHKDVLWNPTPDRMPAAQTQTDFVAKGTKSAAQMRANAPADVRSERAIQGETAEIVRTAKSLAASARDIRATDQLIKRYAAKPILRRRERFQEVRDGMSGMLDAMADGDRTKISSSITRLAGSAEQFKQRRMDEYFEKHGREFDTFSDNAAELEVKLSLPGGGSGARKMLIADHAGHIAKKFAAEREKLLTSIGDTVDKQEGLTPMEIKKLETSVRVLKNLDYADKEASALLTRAEARLRG